MVFDGQVWFDFSTPSVWVFYQWLRSLAQTDTEVSIEWLPYPADGEKRAMATLLGIEGADDRGRFIHAMLGLVHIEKRPVNDRPTVLAALDAAGLESDIVRDDHPLLEELSVRADGLGIDALPSLVRHGPVLSIQLNPAVLDARPRRVAKIINGVIDNDGIWELRKP